MVTVRRSTIIDAPVEAVWELVRDFNGHDRWHPAVERSRIEQGRGADEVGCVRDFRLADGGRIREQLLRLSDRDRSFTYCILEAPLPLVDYVATLSLKPVTDGNRTFCQWQGRFRPPSGRVAELASIVGEQIYEAGFAAIRERVASAPDALDRNVGERTAAASTPRVRRRVDPGPRPGPSESLTGEAIVMNRHGGPEVLELGRGEAVPPRQGEVRLRHTALGVNYIDVYCRTGYFPLIEPPGVPGMEAAGVVVDVGPGVDHLAAGDRVAYACAPPGAYCEFRTMTGELVVPLPDDLDDLTAAAVMLKGMSAEFLLHRVHAIRSEQVILVHAAAGGVGSLLCQWASDIGATVIGAVGNAEKANLARENGCHHVLVYDRDDLVASVMDITTGQGVDVVYDAVGAATLDRSFECLAVRGHLVSYGQASGAIPPVDIAAYASRSAMISRPNFVHYAGTGDAVRDITTRLFPMLSSGRLRPRIGLTMPLSAAAEAHRRLESRKTTGSIVLTVRD